MDLVPAGNSNVQREHSATSESKQMEVSKDLGHTKVLEKSSSFQSDERSMVVEESSTQSMESSRTVQASVTSSVTSQKKVTQASFSSSSSFEASEGNGKANSITNQETTIPLESTNTNAEVDPGPNEPLTVTGTVEPVLEDLPTLPPYEPVKAKSPPKSSLEIEEGNVKNTLKEIISEIDNYAEKDDVLKESKVESISESKTVTESSTDYNSNYENISQFEMTSEAHKPELRTHQDMLMARLPSCLFTSKGDRPLSLPPENLMQLLKSVQIAQELNQVLRTTDDSEQQVRKHLARLLKCSNNLTY